MPYSRNRNRNRGLSCPGTPGAQRKTSVQQIATPRLRFRAIQSELPQKLENAIIVNVYAVFVHVYGVVAKG